MEVDNKWVGSARGEHQRESFGAAGGTEGATASKKDEAMYSKWMTPSDTASRRPMDRRSGESPRLELPRAARRSHARGVLAAGIAFAVSAASATALAVNCPTTQSFTVPTSGRQAIALYTDSQNHQDYAIMGGDLGLFYVTKASSASTWGPVLTIDANVQCTAVTAANGVVICTHGNYAVYQQKRSALNFEKADGPPFLLSNLFPSPGSFANDAISISKDGIVWSACDSFSESCHFFSQNGPGGFYSDQTRFFNYYAAGSVGMQSYLFPQLSRLESAVLGPSTTSPFGMAQSFAFLNSGNCSGTFCTKIYSVGGAQNPLTALLGTINLPPNTYPGQIAAVSDGVIVGLPSNNASTPGSVRVYSSGYAQTGSLSPWNLVATLPPPAGASQSFGILVSAAAGHVLVGDNGPASGGNGNGNKVYTYSINPTNSFSLAASTFSLIGTLVQSAGQFVADDSCAAYDNPFTGEVTLGPIGTLPTNICCTGTICGSQASTSCPRVQGEPSLFIPTISGGFAQPTITNDCTVAKAGFINAQTNVCSTVVFNGAIASGGATYCFPGKYNQNQPILKCELDPVDPTTQLPATCSPTGSTPYPVSGSSPLCCGTAGQLQSSADNDTYTCISGLTGFSTFARGPLLDSDMDAHPDFLDNCSKVSNLFQQDQDNDFVGDACDNCPAVANQNQKNTSGGPVGDACNCALAGVTAGPTGAPCPSVGASATPAPATPTGLGALLGLGLMALGIGVVTRKGRRRLSCAQ